MRYATAGAFRTGLERRLLTTARQENVQLNRLRKMVVFDRLMARLLVVAPDRRMLKGGLALELRFGHRARTTKDMDLSRKGHETAVTADLLAAQMIDLGDYFTFAVRGSLPVPDALPPPPIDWTSPYRLLARDAGLDQDIAIGFGLAAAFLDPVLNGAAGDDAGWEPERGHW